MTPRAIRCRLYELAWLALAKFRHAPPAAVEVIVGDDATELRLSLRPKRPALAEATEPAEAMPLALRLAFSPPERQVVTAIGAGKLTAKAIAARLRYLDGSGQANNQIRNLLNNLAERGILDSEDGYTLTTDGAELARQAGLLAYNG